MTNRVFVAVFAVSWVFIGCGAGVGGSDPTPGGDPGGVVDPGSSIPPSSTPSSPIGTSQMDLYASGTRIRIKYLKSSDGAKEFRGWYDTQRQEDCSFVPAADGKTRCLPTRDALYATFYVNESSEVPCGKPAAYRDACAVVPKYEFVIAYDACGAPGRYRMYKSGAVQTSGYYMWHNPSGACMGTSITAGHELIAIGDEVLPTEFAEAAEYVE